MLAATVLASFANFITRSCTVSRAELVAPEHKGASDLIRDGRQRGQRLHRPQSRQRDTRLAARALRRRHRGAGRLMALANLAVMSMIHFPAHAAPAPGNDRGHNVAELARQAGLLPWSRWPRAYRLRRDEPADGSPRRCIALRAAVPRRPALVIEVARAGHVRAGLLHRPPDQRFGARCG